MVISGRLVSVVALLVGLGSSGCSKKRSEAIVIAKEHIDAAENKPSPAIDDVKDRPADTPVEGVTLREMAPDEVAADGFVIKKKDRGTSKDPRAKSEEQWRIEVQIVDSGLLKTIQSDRVHYDKLKVGDRIRVAYYQGKYTGTVWVANIED